MKEYKKITLLKVLVGSRGYNLEDSDSDYDYKSVFVYQTKDLVSMGFTYRANNSIENNVDDTAFELKHFLDLAIKSNPTILEMFIAPVVESNIDGQTLKTLFKYAWSTESAYAAFIGYGYSQRKRLLDETEKRRNKYACAYIRTLYNLISLLQNKTFNVRMKDEEIRNTLLKYKAGNFSIGEAVDHADKLIAIASELKKDCINQEMNHSMLNEFLISMRKKYWEF